MAVSDGSSVLVYKELGLVAQVFDEAILSSLKGHLAIGHCRYSTTGSGTWENAQPSFRTLDTGGNLALGHNGNLTNTAELAERVAELAPRTGQRTMGATTDSDLVTTLLALAPTSRSTSPRWSCCPRSRARSAWCSWTSTPSTPPATRTASGRWCSAGSSAAGSWPARPRRSTSSGASFVREVEPGELLAIDEHGVRSQRFAEKTPKGCLFEYVYLARPDTTIAGQGVYTTRVQVGRTLAFEAPVDADLVMPGARVGHARRPSATPSRAASRTGRGW
jgi:amidophosphoribosyltransferase